MNKADWQNLPGKEKLRRKKAMGWSESLNERGKKKASLHNRLVQTEAHRVPAPVTLPRVSIQEMD